MQRALLSISCGIVLMAFMLLVVPVGHAGNCQTAAKVAADLWKEFDDTAKKMGCAAGTAGSVVLSGGMNLPKTAQIYAECFKKANQYDAITRKMISKWNDLVKNNWATIGPRKLEIGKSYHGTVRSQGTRMFVTPYPLNHDIEVFVTKERFRGKTEVTVCRYPPAGPGRNVQGEKIWTFTVGKGLGNKGQTWSRKLNNVTGYVLSVSLNGKSLVKSMKYQLKTQAIKTDADGGAAEAGGGYVTQEPNTNRGGSDYRNFDLKRADPDLCARACAQDDRCRAYTYVKPGYQGENARCWLKDKVPPKRKDACCVSGTK